MIHTVESHIFLHKDIIYEITQNHHCNDKKLDIFAEVQHMTMKTTTKPPCNNEDHELIPTPFTAFQNNTI